MYKCTQKGAINTLKIKHERFSLLLFLILVFIYTRHTKIVYFYYYYCITTSTTLTKNNKNINLKFITLFLFFWTRVNSKSIIIIMNEKKGTIEEIPFLYNKLELMVPQNCELCVFLMFGLFYYLSLFACA